MDGGPVYVKLFQTILTSTIWRESAPVRVVWITLLVMADREGVVFSSLPGLAAVAGVTIQECEEALTRLADPDPYSGTQTHEGRRIEPVERGWFIINYPYYRDLHDAEQRREQVREAVARHRARREKRTKKGVIKRNQLKSDVSDGKPIQREPSTAPAPTTSSPPRGGWVGEAVAIWRAYQGEMKPGRLGASLKPVVDTHGEAEALRRFRIFANGKDGKFGPDYFATRFHSYGTPQAGDFNPADYSVGAP